MPFPARPASSAVARRRHRARIFAAFAVLTGALGGGSLGAAEAPKAAPKKAEARKADARKARPAPAAESPLAAWVEPDFPFFSSVLDARKAGPAFPADNLSPRALVLNLGGEVWAAFDPDLLRVTAVWRGAGVTPTALAPGSYHDISKKTPGGQTGLPQPEGKVWLATGLYPGWQAGEATELTDPREPAPTAAEPGRGPLPEALGRFEAVRLTGGTAVLEFTVGGTRVAEWYSRSGDAAAPTVERAVEVGAATRPLRLVLGAKAPAAKLALGVAPGAARAVTLTEEKGVATVVIAPGAAPVAFTVAIAAGEALAAPAVRAKPAQITPRRWPQDVVTTVKRSAAKDAYVADAVGLPTENPWRRGFRPSDVQFLRDGTGVVVTLDGDIWLARGLHEPAGPVRWSRFASGLHEPMTAAIRDEEIFVFDKNGLWRLRDTDGNGEADAHELFSNAFAQTADMREFASQVRLGPGGEFVIAKGGQQATTEGKHNGSVLRLSADGRRSTVLGYGFRQPNIGVNIRTGLVTSSDQQGQYIPSTPLHIVRDRQFYGFLPPFAAKEKYPAPPAEPLTWIPHPVNSSAISQVWLFGAQLGPINDEMIHIGFNKPEVFRVLWNRRGSRPQAAVASLVRALDVPLLNGAVNPRDGQLYIAGFQVLGWGNVVDTQAGLVRIRHTGAPVTVPREVVPMENGVLLRFDVALDPKKARDPANYSLQTWAYQRTHKYGSPQYKADGKPGQDALTASSAYLAADGRGVFLGVPGMKPVMQLRVGWSLATADGLAFEENAYTTPYELAKFDPRAEGFGDITVDLTPRTAATAADTGPATLEEGQRLAQLFACVACHATEPNPIVVKNGPAWKGLYGSERTVFAGGKPIKVTVDDAYVREAILDPSAKIAAGYEKSEYAMPSFAGVLTPAQVDALVLYVKSLK